MERFDIAREQGVMNLAEPTTKNGCSRSMLTQSHIVSERTFNISLKFELGLGDKSCFCWSINQGPKRNIRRPLPC